MWTILQNKKEYDAAYARLEELSQNPPDAKSDEGRELMLLGFLIDQYEEKEFPIKYPQPIEAIKARMEDLGLKINDLLDVFGDRGTASKVLNKQRSLSLSMIRTLADRLSLPLTILVQPYASPKVYSKKTPSLKVAESKVVYRRKRKIA
jgi:HTH-type transcriptional regulator / antitoxin HigA